MDTTKDENKTLIDFYLNFARNDQKKL